MTLWGLEPGSLAHVSRLKVRRTAVRRPDADFAELGRVGLEGHQLAAGRRIVRAARPCAYQKPRLPCEFSYLSHAQYTPAPTPVY